MKNAFGEKEMDIWRKLSVRPRVELFYSLSRGGWRELSPGSRRNMGGSALKGTGNNGNLNGHHLLHFYKTEVP